MNIKFGILFTIIFFTAGCTQTPPTPTITNFEECAAAGNPIMESYPRQCRDQDGILFVEQLPDDENTACTMDAKICDDGSSVGRIPPSCEFAPCPGE